MNVSPILGAAAMVAVALSVSALAQATGTQGTVAEVQDGGRKVVIKTRDGKTVTAGVSGSRTKVMIAGQPGDRAAIKAGMTCTVVGAEAAEATSLDCK